MSEPQLQMKSAPIATSSFAGGGNLVRDGEVDIRELLRLLWRRKSIILGTVILGCLLAVLVTYQLRPVFTATTGVMIDPRRTNIVNIDAVVSGIATDNSAVLSEIEILKSYALAEKVVRRLGLVLDPEYNGALREPTGLSRLAGSIADRLGLGGAAAEQTAKPAPAGAAPLIAPPSAADLEMARVTRAVRGRLEVTPEGRSYVIRLEFRSYDPNKAALIANTFAEQYTLNQLDAKLEAVERANSWLNERTAELRGKVAVAERQVEEYRARAGLIGARGERLINQQLSELNSQLIIASADRARAEARLRQARGAGGGAQSVSEVLASPAIQRLRDQETELRRREAELLERYGDRHPRMVNLRAEIRDIENRLRQEMGRISSSLEGELVAAQARENTLKANLAKLQRDAAAANQAEVKLRELEREAEANKSLLETFLERFAETTEQGSIQQSDSRIISRAMAPDAPAFPRLSVNLPVAFGVFLVFGVILAFLAEKLDAGLRSSEQIDSLLGLPTLALIPALSALKGIRPTQHIVDSPGSQFSEAFRTFRTGLLLTGLQKRIKTVLLTSTVPDEGKSSDAICLARSAAQSGQRIVLVDCDLRASTVHKMLGLTPTVGVVDVVQGRVRLEDALLRDEATGLYVLPNVGKHENPPDVLSAPGMAKLVEALGSAFDLVVIDSPPLLAVSDALILGQLVDRVVFVIRWGRTPRAAVVAAVKQLRQAGVAFAGAVLSRVDMRRHATYGYGDSAYAYRGYKKYYYNS